MLELSAIVKDYGPVRALTGVDFSVGEGEIVALAGENGSGKSTLAKIIAGVVRPDEGRIELDGEVREFARPRDGLDAGIAIVSQEVTAVPEITVAENVLLTQLPSGLRIFDRRAATKRAQEVLNQMHLDLDPRALFSTLKSGDKEFVEIARALAARPRLLILDEATSRLGAADVERLFQLLRELRDAGTSTLLITHRLGEICDLADRAVVLRDGERVAELQRSELSEHRLASLMVGRDVEEFFVRDSATVGDVRLKVDELRIDQYAEPCSFNVRAGEIVGLAGLAGAGRSELLETIAGVRKSWGGNFRVDDKDVPEASPRASLEAGIALVPEDRHHQGLVVNASISRNIAMGSWRFMSIVRTGDENDLASESRDRLHIKLSSVGDPVATLSGGNQQKVVVARCLASNPSVLLLDEPTRGVDIGARAEIYSIIGEMLKSGLAVLLASSDLLELLGLADRVLVMYERGIAGELSREEATEERIALLAGGGNHVEEVDLA